MRTLLLLALAAALQDTTDKPAAVTTRAPRKGEFAPGQLSDEVRRKKFDDLIHAIKKGSRAPAKRKRWLEGLEKDFGIYDVATLVVFTAWTLWIWKDLDVAGGEVGSGFLHLVLLPFHEAGHYAIFRWFGQFIMTLGGTLGQHLMPIVLGVALLVRRNDPFGAALFSWLLGFSTLDMAIYMYDAFDPKLMLLGGKTGQESDGHDWQNIFGDLGLIRRSRGIGLFFGVAGMAMMVAALAWAARVLQLQRERISDSLAD